MHKQHPQTAYRKYAVLIGTIFENCDKKAMARGNFPRAMVFYLIQFSACGTLAVCASRLSTRKTMNLQ